MEHRPVRSGAACCAFLHSAKWKMVHVSQVVDAIFSFIAFIDLLHVIAYCYCLLPIAIAYCYCLLPVACCLL